MQAVAEWCVRHRRLVVAWWLLALVLSAAARFPPMLREHRTALQSGIVAAAPQGRQIVIAGTPHAIHHHRPELVADAALQVIVQARRHKARHGGSRHLGRTGAGPARPRYLS